METQNFRPPDERELTFSAYTKQGKAADVCGVDLVTKKVTKYTDTPDEYDEPEGIYPDGQHTLVECDRQNHQGTGHIDLWRLALDGSGDYVRLTHFSDFPDYKASNPVVSDDGRYFAFQMGHAGEAAGVGHGIFVYDIEKAAARSLASCDLLFTRRTARGGSGRAGCTLRSRRARVAGIAPR